MREAIKKRQHDSYRNATGAEFQVELGRAMAASKLLSTQIISTGQSCTLAASLFDLTSETAESGATVTCGCTPAELPTGLDRLVRELVDKLR
jgi:hypothetical protein